MVLYSSRRGVLLGHVTPLILVTLGALAVADDGPHPISIALLVVGVALEAVSLFDYPTRATIGPDGVVRQCALRHQMIPWSRISDIRRAPGPRFRRVAAQPIGPGGPPAHGGRGPGVSGGRSAGAGGGIRAGGARSSPRVGRPGGSTRHSGHVPGVPHAKTRPAPGGLVAACGRRRYLLVDRSEGAEEFDEVLAGLSVWAPGVAIHAVRPPLDWPPTWLYRRRARMTAR